MNPRASVHCFLSLLYSIHFQSINREGVELSALSTSNYILHSKVGRGRNNPTPHIWILEAYPTTATPTGWIAQTHQSSNPNTSAERVESTEEVKKERKKEREDQSQSIDTGPAPTIPMPRSASLFSHFKARLSSLRWTSSLSRQR